MYIIIFSNTTSGSGFIHVLIYSTFLHFLIRVNMTPELQPTYHFGNSLHYYTDMNDSYIHTFKLFLGNTGRLQCHNLLNTSTFSCLLQVTTIFCN